MRGAAAVRLAAAGVLVLAAGPASAQDGIVSNMQKIVDSTFSTVNTTTTDASGAVTRTSSTTVNPRLTLTLDSLLYPNLRLNAGGVFEVNRAFTELFTPGLPAASSDTSVTRLRPFVLLRSTNQMFSPGVGFFRREDRASAQGFPGTKLVNDDYAAYLGWQPAGGPRSDFQFVRTNTFDRGKVLFDTTRDFGSIISNYTWGNLSAHYRGNYLNTNDRLHALETTQTSNAGRLAYSESRLARRLVWNAVYDVNDQQLTTRTRTGQGEVAVPVTANAGLSATSDLPLTAALSSNPGLIDGNRTAGAGIDLGVPEPGTDAQARNFGLDLLNRTTVSRFDVWIDRELTAELAASFSWDVYTSTDNIVWTRESIVQRARYGPFETRFELDFPAVTARYVKLVVRPLSPLLPDASRYPDIQVTELQAFERRAASEAEGVIGETRHVLNANARFRLLDAPSLYYETFYLYNGPDFRGRRRDTFSNGVAIDHSFNRMFAVFGRGAYEQGAQPEGHRDATVTNATLTFTPVPTFRSSVLYTGQIERVAGLPNERRAVFVQNTAHVYRGIDVLFGVGRGYTERETGEISHDRLTNVSATIAPQPHVTLTFSYDDTTSRREGVFVGPRHTKTRRGYASVAVDPLRTLHLVLGEEVIVVTGQKTRTTHTVDVNWAPFAEGALQFIFAYDESFRDLYYGQEQSTLASVRWNLSRRSYLDVSYQRTRSEFVFYSTESGIFSTDVRIYF